MRRYRVPRLQVQHVVGRLLLGFREGRDWLCLIRVRRIGGCAGRLRGKELRARCGCRRRCLEVVCAQGEVYAEGGRKLLDDPGGVAPLLASCPLSLPLSFPRLLSAFAWGRARAQP